MALMSRRLQWFLSFLIILNLGLRPDLAQRSGPLPALKWTAVANGFQHTEGPKWLKITDSAKSFFSSKRRKEYSSDRVGEAWKPLFARIVGPCLAFPSGSIHSPQSNFEILRI